MDGNSRRATIAGRVTWPGRWQRSGTAVLGTVQGTEVKGNRRGFIAGQWSKETSVAEPRSSSNGPGPAVRGQRLGDRCRNTAVVGHSLGNSRRASIRDNGQRATVWGRGLGRRSGRVATSRATVFGRRSGATVAGQRSGVIAGPRSESRVAGQQPPGVIAGPRSWDGGLGQRSESRVARQQS